MNLLFKAKNINGVDQWAAGNYLVLPTEFFNEQIQLTAGKHVEPTGHWIISYGPEEGMARLSAIDPDTLRMWTGLKDSQGELIFEGDRISGMFLFGLPQIGTVGFKDGAFGVIWQRGDYEMFTPFTSTCNVVWTVIEEEDE